MTPEEITLYVYNWWNGRKTLDKKSSDTYWVERDWTDHGNIIVTVHTPWKTAHTAICVFLADENRWWKHPNDMYCEYQWNQYHYSGILPTADLTKKKLYNMMLKQRRVLEHSPTI